MTQFEPNSPRETSTFSSAGGESQDTTTVFGSQDIEAQNSEKDDNFDRK
jgi:hypothetical protein